MLGISFGARQKDTLTGHRCGLDGEVVHGHGKKSGKLTALELGSLVSNSIQHLSLDLCALHTSQNLRISVDFDEPMA